ncbi:MAG: tRNA-intron lyase [Thermoplasmata archaeon]
MPGKIVDDKVLVEDEKEGNTLYNKGYFGVPLSGGGVELTLTEALYLLEAGRLDVFDDNGKAVYKADIMEKLLDGDKGMAIKYPLYRDMRMRGYVLKEATSPAHYRVFPRGGGPNKTPSECWLVAKAETDKFSIVDMEKISLRVEQLKKSLLFGVVDEEGDLTYYKTSTIVLKGEGYQIPKKSVYEAFVAGNRAFVKGDLDELHNKGFYGKDMGEELQISLLEALYLKEEGVLNVYNGFDGKEMDIDTLEEHAENIQKDFDLRYSIYKDLRSKSLIPKTGFKYGTVFRCYIGSPEDFHAQYMIQPVKKNFECSWYDISRVVRVAHSVRKTFIFARDKEDDKTYIKIERETP